MRFIVRKNKHGTYLQVLTSCFSAFLSATSKSSRKGGSSMTLEVFEKKLTAATVCTEVLEVSTQFTRFLGNAVKGYPDQATQTFPKTSCIKKGSKRFQRKFHGKGRRTSDTSSHSRLVADNAALRSDAKMIFQESNSRGGESGGLGETPYRELSAQRMPVRAYARICHGLPCSIKNCPLDDERRFSNDTLLSTDPFALLSPTSLPPSLAALRQL